MRAGRDRPVRQEDQRLALAGQGVELAKGLRDPDDAREATRHAAKALNVIFRMYRSRSVMKPFALGDKAPGIVSYDLSKTAVFNSPVTPI